MSYLDDPRVFFAAERTMLAWQRTSIALIGLGFVIERFGLFVRMLSAPNPVPASVTGVSLVVGSLLLLIGAALASLSALQFRKFISSLSDAEVPRSYALWLGPAAGHTLALTALLLVFWLVLT